MTQDSRKAAARKDDGPRIDFPYGEFWQPVKDYVGFRAMVNKERVDCHITRAALKKHFQLGDDDPVAVFRANRKSIEAIARKLIVKGRTDTEGQLSVEADDC